MVTCYDLWSARILNESDIDTILVGEGLVTVMHDYESTVHAMVPMMSRHIMAVHRGAPGKFVLGDLPFLCARLGRAVAVYEGLGFVVGYVETRGVRRFGFVVVESDGHSIRLIDNVVFAESREALQGGAICAVNNNLIVSAG